MKCGIITYKKVMFLVMVAAGSSSQVKGQVGSTEDQNVDETTFNLTAEIVTVVTDPVTHEEQVVTDTQQIATTETTVTITATHSVANIVIPPTSLDELATLINIGRIKTYDELMQALVHFPELKTLAQKFRSENITTTKVAMQRFVTLKDQKAKSSILSLFTKIKNKDKLWALFRK